MQNLDQQLKSQIKTLSPLEKIRLVDWVLADLDRPNPEIDAIWAEEAGKRWTAYKAGKLKTVPYDEVMQKYQRSA